MSYLNGLVSFLELVISKIYLYICNWVITFIIFGKLKIIKSMEVYTILTKKQSAILSFPYIAQIMLDLP